MCEDRDKLLDLLLVALKAHSDAVKAMVGREGEEWRLAHEAATNTEAIYHDCREVLIAHERSHGCAPKFQTDTTLEIDRRTDS